MLAEMRKQPGGTARNDDTFAAVPTRGLAPNGFYSCGAERHPQHASRDAQAAGWKAYETLRRLPQFRPEGLRPTAFILAVPRGTRNMLAEMRKHPGGTARNDDTFAAVPTRGLAPNGSDFIRGISFLRMGMLY
jgi:hypothetical protein